MMDDDITPDDDDFDFGVHESFGEIGRMGLTIYRSVERFGGSQNEAFNVTAAFFAGMNKGAQEDDDDS